MLTCFQKNVELVVDYDAKFIQGPFAAEIAKITKIELIQGAHLRLIL